jgi:hypothetical protein
VSPVVLRRLLEGVAVLVFVPILALQWPTIEHSFGRLGSVDPRWAAVALGFELVSMRAFAQVQHRMLAVAGAAPATRKMMSLGYASTAINATLPGGSLLSVGYTVRKMRAWGATAPAAAFAVVASGALSTTAFALLVVARAAAGGDTSELLIAAPVVVLGLSALAIRPARRALAKLVISSAQHALNLAARIAHKPSIRNVLDGVGDDLANVHPSRKDWATGLASAELNWLTDLACLVACCEAVGASHAGIAAATAAYVVGMTTSTLSFLPGGLGAVEGGMIVVFVSQHVSAVAATAAVVLYRLMSLILVVGIGWLVVAVESRRPHVPSSAR